MPDDQLASAAEFIDHRRTISSAGIIQRSPDLLTGNFIEADHKSIFHTADQCDDLISVNKRRRRHAPDGQLCAIVFGEVFLPKDRAIDHVHTKHVALSSDEVDSIFINNRSCPRARGITDGVSSKVLMLPKLFSSLRIEAQQPLELTVHNTIRQEDSSIRNGRPRVSFCHGSRPDAR